MTRNIFNQAKHPSQITNSLSAELLRRSASKARQLLLEDNDIIHKKDTCKITNVHPPVDEKILRNLMKLMKGLLLLSMKLSHKQEKQ